MKTDEDRFEEWDKIYFNQTEKDDMKDAYLAGLAEGRRMERKRCAEIADKHRADFPSSHHESGYDSAAAEIAAAIRGKE